MSNNSLEYTIFGSKTGQVFSERWSHVIYDSCRILELLMTQTHVRIILYRSADPTCSGSVQGATSSPRETACRYEVLENIDLYSCEIKTARKDCAVAFKVIPGEKKHSNCDGGDTASRLAVGPDENRFQISFMSEADAAEFIDAYLKIAGRTYLFKIEKLIKIEFLRGIRKLRE